MTRRTIMLAAALVLGGLTSPVSAGPFEDGLAAYERGDHTAALRLFRVAADKGAAAAQFSLGFMYDNGEGTPEDNAEAMKWYRRAADQGHAGAKFNLGIMYGNGGPSGMVTVPAGPSFMGCNESVDNECLNPEKPGRTVNVSGFSIDKTEVTVAQYRECANAGSCSLPDSSSGCNWGASGRESHPINCVDWDQATAFCSWKQKRLPTEAEWEKAARGTDGRKFPWGNQTPTCALANTHGCGTATQPIGSRPNGASPYGALDMAGNVFEWTADWYKVGRFRSARGGAWGSDPTSARASHRGWGLPGDRMPGGGFRCAR